MAQPRTVMAPADRRGLLQHAALAYRLYGIGGTLARSLLLVAESSGFVRRGGSDSERSDRRLLLRKFRAIQSRLVCLHSPFQFTVVADYVLDLSCPGALIECGCYRGGSSAQLSWIAKVTGRKLYICDSFSGLPSESIPGERVLGGYRGRPDVVVREGDFAASLDEVARNIEIHGCPEVCEFVPGYFRESLKRLNGVESAAVICDVDLVSSTRDCLQGLWPQLSAGGVWFFHDAHSADYMQSVMDTQWWMETLSQYPPLVIGAGVGLSPLAPSLACIHKPETTTPSPPRSVIG